MDLYEYLGKSEDEIKEILKGKKMIISLSGTDNVGKTTQAEKLREAYPNIFSKPIHINQMEAFPKLKRQRTI